MYETVIRLAPVADGATVLDLGCGAGSFCRLAADAGARVFGLDASEALVERARTRVPEGEFRVGDIQALPYEDDTFDVVTGFNVFQFAGDPLAALVEAGRVARRGGAVAAAVWAEPARVELVHVMRALSALLPAPPPPPARSLSEPGGLEAAVRDAGLAPRRSGDGTLPFAWQDPDAMLRGITAAGGVIRIERIAGEEVVRSTLLQAMEAFRSPNGGYRLRNDWYYVLATA